jgi:hypothetical protein
MSSVLRILFDEDIVGIDANFKWRETLSEEDSKKLTGWFRVVNDADLATDRQA